MNLRMVRHLASPGVKDREKPRHIAADVLFIRSKLFQSTGRRSEHGVVACLLMTPDKIPHLFRDRESDHEMMAWQALVQLPFQADPQFVVLAYRAMPVSAGPEDRMRFTALIACVNGEAASLCPTIDDGFDPFEMIGRHGTAESIDILRTERPENFIDYGNC